MGIAAAATLHLVGPLAVSVVYGSRYASASAYTGVFAWMVIPQLVEQSLIAVLSTSRALSKLSLLFLLSAGVSLLVPVFANEVFGPHLLAPGIVLGRFLSVAVPVALWIRILRGRSPNRRRV